MRKIVTLLGVLALVMMLAAPVAAVPPGVQEVLLDTMVNDQIYSNQNGTCGARGIEGGTTNGYEKQAASFTVTQLAKVSEVVFPLVVESKKARVEATIVVAKPWDGIDPGTGIGDNSYWDILPDESAVLGQTTTMVEAVGSVCGPVDFVTAKFNPPVAVSPGTVYWVVLQNHGSKTSTFWWINGVNDATFSGIAQEVSDSNGSRWLSYDPAANAWRDSAMRVLGTQP